MNYLLYFRSLVFPFRHTQKSPKVIWNSIERNIPSASIVFFFIQSKIHITLKLLKSGVLFVKSLWASYSRLNNIYMNICMMAIFKFTQHNRGNCWIGCIFSTTLCLLFDSVKRDLFFFPFTHIHQCSGEWQAWFISFMNLSIARTSWHHISYFTCTYFVGKMLFCYKNTKYA